MTDTEARLSTELRRELDAIEPSPSSWEVIRNASTLPPPQDERRPRGWRLSAAAAAVVLLLGLIAAVRVGGVTGDGAELTVTAGGVQRDEITELQSGNGRVSDAVGDAAAGHLDLTHVEVRQTGDAVHIVWALAGAIPVEPALVEYRVTFTDPRPGGDGSAVVIARLEGRTMALGVVTCALDGARRPDCTGRPVTTITTPLQIDGGVIAATVPVGALPIQLDGSLWVAEVLQRH